MRRPSSISDGHDLHQMVELGAGADLARRRELHEARVAAHLAQLQQRVEDHDAAARKALRGDFLAHLVVHREPHGLVEIALRPGQFERADDLGFRRQLAGDQVLGPAQQERLQPRRQHGPPLAIVPLFDRRAEHAGEALRVAEQPRHQKGELRPQFAEMVLDRRAGQAQPVPRVEPADELASPSPRRS